VFGGPNNVDDDIEAQIAALRPPRSSLRVADAGGNDNEPA